MKVTLSPPVSTIQDDHAPQSQYKTKNGRMLFSIDDMWTAIFMNEKKLDGREIKERANRIMDLLDRKEFNNEGTKNDQQKH